MGASISRSFSPFAAKTMISNANSSILKSALQNYIKAVNNLKNNNRTENKLVSLMNNTRTGLSNSYKKRITNSIASIVAKAPRVAAKAAEAVAGMTPEAQAAAAVKNLTNRVNNLNKFMNTLTGTQTNQFNKYFKSGRNINNNININSKRPNGSPKYQSLLANLGRARLMNEARVKPAIPAPVGLAGKLFNTRKMAANENQYNYSSNYKYIVNQIINKKNNNGNPVYPTNANKVAAIIAFNPTLNWKKLREGGPVRPNMNSILNQVRGAIMAAPVNAAAPANLNEATGNGLRSMFGNEALTNRASLNSVLAKTTNNKLKTNVNTRSKIDMLTSEVKNAATAAGVMMNNKNVKEALNRLDTHKNTLAAQLLYKQAYGGVGGIGLKSGQWTVNKSVNALAGSNNKMNIFRGISKNAIIRNLNAKQNKGQVARAKSVLNAIITRRNL